MPAKTVIKLRRDTTANWESVDPTLAAGEIAFDTTAMKFKVGDGTSAWTDLDYSSDPESVVASLESYADGVASAAQSAAEDYADGLASNYDPAGTASSAVTAHNDDTTSVHGIADTTLLFTTAGGTLTGYLNLHADPTQALHAATKEYVDNVATGIVAKPQVLGATTANIDATYDNGAAGVGATLTHNTNGVFPSTAGGATGWQLGSGILVKNQTNKAQNGRYYISNMGSASTPYVLTRCGYCDTANEIPGAYIFVQGGTSAGTGWIQVVSDPATFVVGTDNIDVFQFSGAGTYTAGNGLTLTGNSFAVDGTAVPLIQLTTPTEGQTLIYNESTGLWNNGEGGSSVEVSQAAPAAPEVGDVWFNSTEGTSYIYYDGYWVPLSPAVAGPEGPAGATGPTGSQGDIGPTGPGVASGGTSGQVLAKSSSTDYDTQWSTLPAAPSGNAIINGAFEINQRKLTSTPGITFFSASFGTDRWINYLDYHSNFSYQSLNESTVPTINSLRLGSVSMDNPYPYRLSVGQKIEDLNTYNLRGKTVTLSFYIKFNSSTFTSSFGPTPFNNFRYEIGYNTSTTNSAFRVSGHPDIPTSIADSYNFSTITNGFLPTTWTRITLTGTVPSTANNIHVGFGFEGAGYTSTNNELNYEITGVQLEAGSVATPFRRNDPSIQAELAACQRYYYRSTTAATFATHGLGTGFSSTRAVIGIVLPVTMRVAPTSVDFGNLQVTDITTNTAATNITFTSGNATTNQYVSIDATVASGLTQHRPYFLRNNNNTAGFIGFSAEL